MFLHTSKPFSDLCISAIKLGEQGDLSEARLAIDRLRGLSHLLESTLFELSEESNVAVLSDQDIELLAPLVAKLPDTQSSLDLIFEWIRLSFESFSMEELLHSRAGHDLIIDYKLPKRWSFKRDIAVVCGPFSDSFARALADRGQEKFVILGCEAPEIFDDFDEAYNNIKMVVSSGEELPDLRVLRDVFGTNKTCQALISESSSEAHIRAFESIQQRMDALSVSANTARWLPRQTTLQFLTGMDYLARCSPVSVLKPVIHMADVLMVAPGPSLADSVADLREIAPRFTIIAAIKAVDFLLDNGIYPDFAVWQDPRDHEFALPTHSLSRSIPLILTESCHRKFFEAGFTNYYITPDPQFLSSKLSRLIHHEDSLFLSAGSVSTLAVRIALAFNCKSITLVGHDLSVAGGAYVTRSNGDKDKGSSTESPATALTCKSISGETLPTLPNYLSFVLEFEEIAKEFPEAALFNCTSEGAFLDGWRHCQLADHLLFDNIEDETRRRDIVVPPSLPPDQVQARKVAICVELENLSNSMFALAGLCDQFCKLLQKSQFDASHDADLVTMEQRLRNQINQSNLVFLGTFISSHTLDVIDASLVVSSDEESLNLKLDYFSCIMRSCFRLGNLLRTESERLSL